MSVTAMFGEAEWCPFSEKAASGWFAGHEECPGCGQIIGTYPGERTPVFLSHRVHEPCPYTAEQITEIVADIESNPAPQIGFIEGRYPYTYAYDYIRTHSEKFGIPNGWSRGQCSQLFMLVPREEKEAMCKILADAYMREYNIVKDDQ